MKILLDNTHWVKIRDYVIKYDSICCLDVYCLDSEAECKSCRLYGKELSINELKKEGLVKEHD